jgi:hypothetical protein
MKKIREANMTIILGWWLIPFIITLACILCASLLIDTEGNDYFGIGTAFNFGVWLFFMFISAIAWLIYFIFN